METDKLLQFIERKPTKKLKSKMTMNSEETQANSQIDDVTTIYSDDNEEDGGREVNEEVEGELKYADESTGNGDDWGGEGEW